LKKHGLATLGTRPGGKRNLGRNLIGVGLRKRLSILRERTGTKLLLQSQQARANRSTEEAKVTDLHKAMGEDMLKEAMNEFLSGERTQFELSSIGSAVLKGDLRRFHIASVHHFDQTVIADGNAVDIRS